MLNIAESVLHMLSLQCCRLQVAVSRVIVCVPKVGKQLGQPPAFKMTITLQARKGS